MVDLFRTPLFTSREAARHLRMPETTLNTWLATGGKEPLIHAVEPEKRSWPRVPFVALIEAYVLRSLRDLYWDFDEIRGAAEYVRSEFNNPYALADKRIVTDGVDLFVELADKSLVRPKTHQLALREVIADELRFVDWDKAGQPRQLRLRQYPDEAEVVIDPRFGWGAPVLARSKVPVDAVLALWRSGEPMSAVAQEFGLTQDVIEHVLRTAA